jgi:PEP-CTERM motif
MNMTTPRNAIGSLAALAAIALPLAVEAAPQVSALSNVALPDLAGTLFDLDINGDSSDDFALYANSDNITSAANFSGGFANAFIVGATSTATRLTVGTPIGSGSDIIQSAELPTFDGMTGYAGFKFKISGADHYAWLLLDFTNINDRRIVSAAWETTPGAAINAGAIPEPASAAVLLGLGAAAAAAMRRPQRRDRSMDV